MITAKNRGIIRCKSNGHFSKYKRWKLKCSKCNHFFHSGVSKRNDVICGNCLNDLRRNNEIIMYDVIELPIVQLNKEVTNETPLKILNIKILENKMRTESVICDRNNKIEADSNINNELNGRTNSNLPINEDNDLLSAANSTDGSNAVNIMNDNLLINEDVDSINTPNGTDERHGMNINSNTNNAMTDHELNENEHSFNSIYCANCKRWKTVYRNEGFEFKALYDLSINEVVIKKTSLRRKFSTLSLAAVGSIIWLHTSDTVKLNLCNHCNLYFTITKHTKTTLKKYSWPVIIWRLLSSGDVYSNHGNRLWRIIPLQWQQWWIKSVTSLLPINMYPHNIIIDVCPIVIDVTIQKKIWNSV